MVVLRGRNPHALVSCNLAVQDMQDEVSKIASLLGLDAAGDWEKGGRCYDF